MNEAHIAGLKRDLENAKTDEDRARLKAELDAALAPVVERAVRKPAEKAVAAKRVRK